MPYRDRRPHDQRRRAWGLALITAVKLDSGCVDCGFNEWPEALEFDHVVDTKRHDVGQMVAYSESAIWAEIEKCEVVCANCHAHRTAIRRRQQEEGNG